MKKLHLNDIERLIIDSRIELKEVKSKLISMDFIAESRKLTDEELSKRSILENKRKKLNGKIRKLKELKEDKTKKRDDIILYSGLGILAVVCILLNINLNSLKIQGNTSSVPTAVVATATPTAIPTASPTIMPIEITDEDVYKVADQIYNKEFAKIASRSSMSEEGMKSWIADIALLFFSGEKPINRELIGISSIDYVFSNAVELLGELGNPDKDGEKLYSVNHEDFVLKVEDEEDLIFKMFVKKYDKVYEETSDAINNKEHSKAKQKIIELTEMMHDDFVLAGMYSGINPYTFKQEYLAGALLVAIDRYALIAEYMFQYGQICTELCINQDTLEMELVNVYSVFEAITSKSGKSSDGKIVLDSLPKEYDIKDKSLVDVFNEALLQYFIDKNTTRLMLG